MWVRRRERGAGPRSPALIESSDDDRSEHEGFVGRRFHEVYGARLYTFLPRLFGIRDASGALEAVVGMRRASDESLFLERYLSVPIEALVAARAGRAVPRMRIAEIGNLAGATPGALRAVIPEVTRLLARSGIDWIAFTGPARICNGFFRLGLPLVVAAPAAVERLPEAERQCWGTYYDHGPSVMIGEVQAGLHLLRGPAGDEGLSVLAQVGAP
jgi:hypothetical protein